ncbi:Protein FAR1-RELATED SEQUENCE [Arachis hypogaea]|nr:Protein FAR1-RELATED SEQUENCE [Arachis hypogaea]
MNGTTTKALSAIRAVNPGEKSVGGAVDGNRSAGADDMTEGGLSRPVGAQDFLGKEFATEEDAYAAYKEFAKLRGFGVRKDVACVNGVLIRRDFFCHRQGTRHPKHYDRPEGVSEERLESRMDFIHPRMNCSIQIVLVPFRTTKMGPPTICFYPDEGVIMMIVHRYLLNDQSPYENDSSHPSLNSSTTKERHIQLLPPHEALVYAKKEIDNAHLVNENPDLYAPSG